MVDSQRNDIGTSVSLNEQQIHEAVFILVESLRAAVNRSDVVKILGQVKQVEDPSVSRLLQQIQIDIGSVNRSIMELNAVLPEGAINPHLAMRIEDAQLSVRAKRRLKRGGIETVAQLVLLTERELLTGRGNIYGDQKNESQNFGVTSFNEVLAFLQGLGLKLKDSSVGT